MLLMGIGIMGYKLVDCNSVRTIQEVAKIYLRHHHFVDYATTIPQCTYYNIMYMHMKPCPIGCTI